MAKNKSKSAAAVMKKVEEISGLKSFWTEYPKDGEVVGNRLTHSK